VLYMTFIHDSVIELCNKEGRWKGWIIQERNWTDELSLCRRHQHRILHITHGFLVRIGECLPELVAEVASTKSAVVGRLHFSFTKSRMRWNSVSFFHVFGTSLNVIQNRNTCRDIADRLAWGIHFQDVKIWSWWSEVTFPDQFIGLFHDLG